MINKAKKQNLWGRFCFSAVGSAIFIFEENSDTILLES